MELGSISIDCAATGPEQTTIKWYKVIRYVLIIQNI